VSHRHCGDPEGLAAGREDRVDRQRALAPVQTENVIARAMLNAIVVVSSATP
jgi:CTP:molybdopterin cytidylyltransferase MocA